MLLTYPKADVARQWFANAHPGSTFPKVEKVVWHTTEGTGWPSYSGGSVAPHYTAYSDYSNETVRWRAHFPDRMNSRALVNQAGGVQTNLDGALQVEIVGTCDPSRVGIWKGDFLKSWALETWQVEAFARFALYAKTEHGVPFAAPALWLKYGKDSRVPGRVPASFGASPARMTGKAWDAFRGHCGHQHVPENHHGDPGGLQIDRILNRARQLAASATPTTPEKDAVMPENFLETKIELTERAAAALNATTANGTNKKDDELPFRQIVQWPPAVQQLRGDTAHSFQVVNAALAGLGTRITELTAEVKRLGAALADDSK